MATPNLKLIAVGDIFPTKDNQRNVGGKVCGDPKKFPEDLRVRSMPK